MLSSSLSPDRRADAMIFLYADVMYRAGGIETYLHALSSKLLAEHRPFRVAVAELEPCVAVDELVQNGIDVYRQKRLPGDRWRVRQRVLMWWLSRQLRPGDWVFCVRQPMPELHHALVRLVHRREAKLAVSWMLPPADVIPPARYKALASAAVAETDAVISTHHATLGQYAEIFGYQGPVAVVPYHNLPSFAETVPMPPGPPWKIGFMGRLDIRQKNLDVILQSFAQLRRSGIPAELHLHGGGAEEEKLRTIATELGLKEGEAIWFHGFYNHQRELRQVVESNHFFVYASRCEGLPLTLLELLQAGRYCVATRVGGVPDLYDGHPECGTLVEPGDVPALSKALTEAVEKVAAGRINDDAIRARYLEAFDIHSAHKAWLSALGLSPEPASTR